MSFLPVCNIAVHQPIKTYYTGTDDYQQLCRVIENYVGADCWAIRVDDEVIYNAYETNKTYKEMLNENGYRIQIIKNPHRSILVHIHRRAVNAKVEIYMFPKHLSYKIMFLYEANQKKWTQQQYNSPEYLSSGGLEVEF